MPLSVGGQILADLNQLSPKARLVLAFVVDGVKWFDWAAQSKDAYAFPDETVLVESIQSGVHGNGLTLLTRLGSEVDVLRLGQLSLEALSILESAEENGVKSKKPNLKTARALAHNHLYTQEGLAQGAQFLTELGVEDEPVFQAMGLLDQIAVSNLAEGDVDASPEAATYAVEKAVNPVEFVDYYQFYLAVTDSMRGKPNYGRRVTRADETLDLLEPWVAPMLRCPSAPRRLSPANAYSLCREWLDAGQPMGFGRFSQGIKEIVGFCGGKITDWTAAKRAVETYSQTLKELLLNHQPVSEQLTQDGSTQQFKVNGHEVSAVMARNRVQKVLTVETLQVKIEMFDNGAT